MPKKPVLACRDKEHRHGEPRSRPAPVAALEPAAQLFRALGDAPRLQLLQLLTQGEWCVSEMVSALGEKFSTVSQRLRTLRNERLVKRRRKGTHLFYALADRHVADLVHNALAHADELRSTRPVPARVDVSDREGEKR